MRWVSAFGVSLLAYAFLILCYIIVSKRSATELLDTASEIIRRRGHKCQLIKSSSTNHSYSLKPYYWAAYDDFDRFSSLISSRRALFISEGDQHITARNNNSNDKKRRTRRISVLQAVAGISVEQFSHMWTVENATIQSSMLKDERVDSVLFKSAQCFDSSAFDVTNEHKFCQYHRRHALQEYLPKIQCNSRDSMIIIEYSLDIVVPIGTDQISTTKYISDQVGISATNIVNIIENLNFMHSKNSSTNRISTGEELLRVSLIPATSDTIEMKLSQGRWGNKLVQMYADQSSVYLLLQLALVVVVSMYIVLAIVKLLHPQLSWVVCFMENTLSSLWSSYIYDSNMSDRSEDVLLFSRLSTLDTDAVTNPSTHRSPIDTSNPWCDPSMCRTLDNNTMKLQDCVEEKPNYLRSYENLVPIDRNINILHNFLPPEDDRLSEDLHSLSAFPAPSKGIIRKCGKELAVQKLLKISRRARETIGQMPNFNQFSESNPRDTVSKDKETPVKTSHIKSSFSSVRGVDWSLSSSVIDCNVTLSVADSAVERIVPRCSESPWGEHSSVTVSLSEQYTKEPTQSLSDRVDSNGMDNIVRRDDRDDNLISVQLLNESAVTTQPEYLQVLYMKFSSIIDDIFMGLKNAYHHIYLFVHTLYSEKLIYSVENNYSILTPEWLFGTMDYNSYSMANDNVKTDVSKELSKDIEKERRNECSTPPRTTQCFISERVQPVKEDGVVASPAPSTPKSILRRTSSGLRSSNLKVIFKKQSPDILNSDEKSTKEPHCDCGERGEREGYNALLANMFMDAILPAEYTSESSTRASKRSTQQRDQLGGRKYRVIRGIEMDKDARDELRLQGGPAVLYGRN